MSTGVTVAIVIAIIAAIGGAIGAYYYVRHTRGSMKLNLVNTGFNPGDTISGSLSMETRKPLEGKRLIVSVIGKEITEERDPGNSNTTRTRTREIYRDVKELEGPMTYPIGHSKDYTFEMKAPGGGGSDSMGGALGQAMDIGIGLLTGTNRRLEWQVEARLDCSGVDLADSQRIYIHTGPGSM